MGLYDQNKNSNSLHGKTGPASGFGPKGPINHGNNVDPAKHGNPARGGVAAPHTAPGMGRGPENAPKPGGSLGARPNNVNVQKGAGMPMNGHPQGIQPQPGVQRTVSNPAKPDYQKSVGNPAKPDYQKTVNTPSKPGVQNAQHTYQKTVASPSQNYQKTVQSPSQSSGGYQKSVNWGAGGAAGAAASAPYAVTFNEKINYMDPVYNLIELNFAGSIMVSSNEHRETEASKELVRTTIKSTLTQKLSQLAASKTNMKEIYPEYNNLKEACTRSLGVKGFDVARINLNGFTLTEKSREKIEEMEKSSQYGHITPGALRRQLEEAQRNAQAYVDNMNPMGYNPMQDPYQAQMYQNQMNGQMYQGQMGQMYQGQMNQPYMDNMNPMGYNQMQDPYQAQMMQNQMNGQMYPNQMQGQMGQGYPNQMNQPYMDNMNPMGYNQMQDPYQAQMMQNQMNGQMQGQMGGVAGAFAGAVGAAAQAMGVAMPSTFCPQCGTQNAGTGFCMNCGAKL